MTPYFAVLSFINIITVVMFFIDILGNSICNKYQKTNLVLTCVMLLSICICEIFTTILDGAPVKYRFWHIAANFIGFSLAPGINFTLGRSVFPKSNKRFNFFFIIWMAYILFMLVCVCLGTDHGIICVDEKNNYYRGKEFFLFIILYSCGILFFFAENLYISIRFWKKTNIVLIINFFFVLFATSVQVVFPTVQVSWTCIILSIIHYYLYYESLYQQMDIQTYLLNYTSLKKWKKAQKSPVVIVIAELDNYAKLKMNYTREQITKILVTISKLFNSFYKSYGRCYRIGSEEFAVIINNTEIDIEKLNKAFFIQLVKYNFEMADMPLVSIGYAQMDPETELDQALSLADAKKRVFIKERLSYLY